MTVISICVERLPHGKDLDLPAHATDRSAGADLVAANATTTVLPPGGRLLVPTGIRIALPEGFEAQIRPRSGLALRHGVTVLNAPGTIDADYRGEIGVVLINLGEAPFTIERGMRIAQLVVAACARSAWQEVADLPASGRGEGGFGSTGLNAKRVGE